MTFGFQIEGDASKADKAISTTLDRLEALKRSAAQLALTPGLDKMAAGFAKLGEAIRKEQSALARTAQLHQQLTAQNTPLAKSFAGVAEAIQREQQMLERIHGPAKQHIQDIQTLDALMKKGAISAREYAMATTRSPSVGSYNVAKVGLPGMGGMGGIAAAAGGVLGGQAAFGALDDFQNMQNRLRFLAGGDMQKVNSMFTQLQGVAGRTRQSLGATTETFVKVSMATKQMGMSTGDTMKFMERLNKAVALSGASSSAASAGLMQLSQGLGAGALRGEEFNSVVEQIPAVADVIAKSLGVTTGQLRQMAQDGRLTSDVVVNAFSKMGDSIDKDFGNTLPTVGQHWTAFKDKITLAIGEMDRAIDVSGKLGAALGYVGDSLSISSLKGGKGAVFDVANVLSFGQAGRNLENRLTREANESLKGVQDVMSQIKETTDEWGHAITVVTNELEAAGFASTDLMGKYNTAAAGIRQFEKDFDSIDKLLNSPMRGQLTVADKFKPSADAIRKAKELREEYEKLARALLSVESVSARAIRTGASERAANQAQDDYISTLETKATPAVELFRAELEQLENAYAKLGLTEAAYIQERNRLYAEGFDKGLFSSGQPANGNGAQTKAHEEWTSTVKMYEEINAKSREMAEEQKRQAQEVREAWADGLGSITGEIIQMAAAGDVSFDKIGKQLVILAIRMAAMSMGGAPGAFLGGLIGGFAHGGVIAEGGGGTDSQLVAFRKSPNERVTIETPEQQRTGSLRGGSGGGGAPALHFHFSNDRRDLVAGMDSREGARVNVNLRRKYG